MIKSNKNVRKNANKSKKMTKKSIIVNWPVIYKKNYNNDTIDKSKNMGELREPGVRTWRRKITRERMTWSI